MADEDNPLRKKPGAVGRGRAEDVPDETWYLGPGPGPGLGVARSRPVK
ncbi:hypothetical protein [Streptomyces tauricus]